MSSHHTAIGANSLEHKERYDIITGEEWYILVKVYGTPSGGGKYIGFGLRIETGVEDHHDDRRYLRHNPARTRRHLFFVLLCSSH